MVNREKENLTIAENALGQPIGIRIQNPQLLSNLDLFKTIVKYQLDIDEKREIIIETGGKKIHISQEHLSQVKSLPEDVKEKKIKLIASAMHNADKVLIQVPNPFKDAFKNFIEESDIIANTSVIGQASILEERIIRKPNEDQAKMIIKAQSFWSDRAIRAQWHTKKGTTEITINPNECKNNPEELAIFSRTITGADEVRILKIAV